MPIDKKIRQFYEDRGYKYSDFFDSKRHGGVRLNKAQVKAGMKLYYDKVMSGEIENPKPMSAGWGVIEQAKTARYDAELQDEFLLSHSKKIIGDLEVEKRFWKACFWICFIAGSLGLGVFANVVQGF